MNLIQRSAISPAANSSPEIKLMICCARTHLDATTKENIRLILQQEIDWNYLLETAKRHKVLPLLARSLNSLGTEVLPEPISSQFSGYLRENALRNLFLISELLKLLELFEKNNIAAIPFKGPVLATLAYGDLSLRQINDLDFLVEAQNFQRTLDLLITQGYQVTLQVSWACHLVSKDGFLHIDLHQEIVPKHLFCSYSSNYIWNNLESFPLNGKIVSNPTPEAWLLILCLNGTKDQWPKLNRICDIAELIQAHPNMDWQQIVEQAEKMGFKRLIFLGLLLASNLLGASFPDFIWQQMQSDPVAQSLAWQVQKKLFSKNKPFPKYFKELKLVSPKRVERELFPIKIRERWQDKAQSCLMSLLFWLRPTARDRDVIQLPALLSFLYYLIRPVRVLMKYGHEVFNYFKG